MGVQRHRDRHTVNTGVQFVNCWRPGPETASGIYVSGLLWFLVHAAVQFSRMLFVQPVDREPTHRAMMCTQSPDEYCVPSA